MSVVQVPLHGRGGVVRGYALVDAADAPAVNAHRWHLASRHYAGTRIDGPQRTLMHHFLLGRPPAGHCVDHINGNTLDNRRANLRVVTFMGNQQNRRGAARGSTSRHRGVSWNRRLEKWQAFASLEGRNRYIGVFETEEAAADAAAAFRAEHMPCAAEARA